MPVSNPPQSTTAPSHCNHCASIIPRGAAIFSSDTSDSERVFCCTGCRAVFEFLQAAKLQRYYDIRAADERAQAFPARPPAHGYEHFDDSSIQQRYVKNTTAESAEVTLFLPGIHCAACVWLLERLPHIVPAIRSARVTLAKATVVVVYDPSKTSLSHIARTIASLGYSPELLDPLEQARHRSRDLVGRGLLMQLGIAGFAAMNTMMFAVSLYQAEWTGISDYFKNLLSWVSLVISLPAVTYAALPFYRTALGSLRAGRIHIDLPVSLGILAGFALSVINTCRGSLEVYYDSVTGLIFFLLIGRVVHQRTLALVLNNSDLLSTIAPAQAVRIDPLTAETNIVATTTLAVGDHIEVASDQIIPVDGLVSTLRATIDCAALTGESAPRQIVAGDQVYAGTKNVGPAIRVAVQAVGEKTRFGQILTSVSASRDSRAPIEHYADRIGRYFTVVVLLLSFATFWGWYAAGPFTAAYTAISLLVVTCPCALAIATPLVFSVALQRAARNGIFIKGADVIERVTSLTQIAFDKTGTLTEGRLTVVSDAWWDRGSAALVAPFVAALEHGVEHPVAHAARSWAASVPLPEQDRPAPQLRERTLMAGLGIAGSISGSADSSTERWTIGKLDLFPTATAAARTTAAEWASRGISPLGVGKDGCLLGLLGVRDSIKPEARALIQALRAKGYRLHMLSGDHQAIVTQIAAELGFEPGTARGDLSPEAKVAAIQAALRDGPIAMVGDGVNDAGALRAATIGIGVRGGAEACMRVADIYATRPELNVVTAILDGANRTLAAVRRNLYLSVGYNIVGGTAAISGVLHPLLAAILMPLSSITVILASFRGRNFDS